MVTSVLTYPVLLVLYIVYRILPTLEIIVNAWAYSMISTGSHLACGQCVLRTGTVFTGWSRTILRMMCLVLGMLFSLGKKSPEQVRF